MYTHDLCYQYCRLIFRAVGFHKYTALTKLGDGCVRAKYGSEVEDAFQMEQRSITKNLNEIRSALEKGKPVQR